MRSIGQRRLGPVVWMAAATGFAPSVSAETLNAALARVYRGNPQLNAERARQRSDDENVPRALSGFLPSISGTAGFGPAYQRGTGVTPGTSQPLTLGITVDQNVYDAGRTFNSVRSAESNVFGGRATLRGVQQNVLLSAVQAYMDVLRDAALVNLQANNVTALRETLRIARARYRSGDTRQTDTAQAEARLASGDANLARARTTLLASRATYRQIIGAEPDALIFPGAVDQRLPGSLAAAIAGARAHHPSIRAAMHAVDAAQSDVQVAAADLRPSIRLGGSLTQSIGPSPDDNGTGPLSLGPQLTVPFYDGGLASAQVRQAKETVSQRRAELESTRADVVSSLRAAWGALEASRAAIPANEAAVSANKVALEGVTREALEGQRTTLDVLNAQQELVNAETNLIVARRDFVVASYAALSAFGELDAARLGLGGPRYRAETHYEQVRGLKYGTGIPDGR